MPQNSNNIFAQRSQWLSLRVLYLIFLANKWVNIGWNSNIYIYIWIGKGIWLNSFSCFYNTWSSYLRSLSCWLLSMVCESLVFTLNSKLDYSHYNNRGAQWMCLQRCFSRNQKDVRIGIYYFYGSSLTYHWHSKNLHLHWHCKCQTGKNCCQLAQGLHFQVNTVCFCKYVLLDERRREKNVLNGWYLCLSSVRFCCKYLVPD